MTKKELLAALVDVPDRANVSIHIADRELAPVAKVEIEGRRNRRGDRWLDAEVVLKRKLKHIKAELRRRMHQPIPEQGRWLRQVVTGHFAYYAVPTNSRALSAFRHHVTDLWRRTLRRRSQKDGFTWDRMVGRCVCRLDIVEEIT